MWKLSHSEKKIWLREKEEGGKQWEERKRERENVERDISKPTAKPNIPVNSVNSGMKMKISGA